MIEKIYDITLPLTPGMITYPEDPLYIQKQVYSLTKGDSFNLTVLKMGSHTGTHLDAPSHCLLQGNTVDKISLQDLMGAAKVIEIKEAVKFILPEHLQGKDIRNGDRILFKTRNSLQLKKGVFDENYVSLSPHTAEYLVQKGIKLVGIDYLSIDSLPSESERSSCHQILLSAGVVILESLALEGVPEGEYDLIALPLRITGCDGSPVRAILLENGSLNF